MRSLADIVLGKNKPIQRKTNEAGDSAIIKKLRVATPDELVSYLDAIEDNIVGVEDKVVFKDRALDDDISETLQAIGKAIKMLKSASKRITELKIKK